MRRDCLHYLAILVIHLEFFLLVDGIDRLAANDNAFLEHEMAQSFSQIWIFADDLGDNMARAFEGILCRINLLLRIDEAGGEFEQGLPRRLLLPQVESKRLETFLACNGCLGTTLRTVREIEVF